MAVGTVLIRAGRTLLGLVGLAVIDIVAGILIGQGGRAVGAAGVALWLGGGLALGFFIAFAPDDDDSDHPIVGFVCGLLTIVLVISGLLVFFWPGVWLQAPYGRQVDSTITEVVCESDEEGPCRLRYRLSDESGDLGWVSGLCDTATTHRTDESVRVWIAPIGRAAPLPLDCWKSAARARTGLLAWLGGAALMLLLRAGSDGFDEWEDRRWPRRQSPNEPSAAAETESPPAQPVVDDPHWRPQ